MNRLTKWIVDRLIKDKETLDYVVSKRPASDTGSTFKMVTVYNEETISKEAIDNDIYGYIGLTDVENKIKRDIAEQIYPYVQVIKTGDRCGKYHYLVSVKVCKDIYPVRNDLEADFNDYKNRKPDNGN